MQRREWIKTVAGAGVLASMVGCATRAAAPAKAQVLVVGGGYGGATAAKYIRLFSRNTVDVVLVEPNPNFVSCPISNLVVGGVRQMSDITTSYEGLRSRHGVTVVQDTVTAIDAARKSARLANGSDIRYDTLVLSPGVDLQLDAIQGLRQANADGQVLHAWKAGAETAALFDQLRAMPDGGVFAISIPEAPYRCPPGPYERASMVASYLKKNKPRAKVLIVDANQDVTSKGPLFKKAWAELYPGMIEYRGQHKLVGVDLPSRTLRFDLQDAVKADVLNVIPPMRAGALAVQTGLANANARWCHVDFLSFESTATPGIHVLGDSIQIAPGMPKSGHMANNQAKVAAAAIVARIKGLPVNTSPMLTNTCYSFVSPGEVIHVASVHEYVAAEKTFKTVAGSGGVSAARSELEATYAMAWARTIWADALA